MTEDVLGKIVVHFVRETRSAGRCRVVFDASRLPSGMYFYLLELGGSELALRILLTEVFNASLRCQPCQTSAFRASLRLTRQVRDATLFTEPSHDAQN